MSKIPKELRYTETHEWIKSEPDNIFTVGITDYAQAQLGDIVYVDLPELNRQIDAGDEVAVVESVKTASDVYAVLAGEIIAVNEHLAAQPNLINQDPYEQGWLYRVRSKDQSTWRELLDAHDYRAEIEED